MNPPVTPVARPCPLVRVVTALSAAALVAASAGFGAFYAWTTGSHHGPFVGGLSVLMALGLEGAKPFAIEGAFAALRSWAPIRAVALIALGSAAVVYSLTAELSLMAATRADVSAQRTQAADTVAAARARYAAAQHELEALPVTRPLATLNAEIERLKTTPRLASCDDTSAPAYGPVTRRVCGTMAALAAEAATTARRVELQELLRDAERDLVNAPPATEGDPAASALATYLAAAGVPSDPGTLSKWIALVPVLALEVGSALAALLASGTVVPRAPGREHIEIVHRTSSRTITGCDSLGGDEHSLNGSAAQRPVPASLKAAILEQVKAHGGILRTSQRGLAKANGRINIGATSCSAFASGDWYRRTPHCSFGH